jgi:hypothetical protein
MNKKVVIGQKKIQVTITDKDYLAAGGEAEIYTHGGKVYKLYHDPVAKMLPLQKMQELSCITDPQVVLPEDVIYDSKTGAPLGYTTRFVDNVDPILKIFNRAYKTTNNITPQMVADLVKKLQGTLSSIHSAQCLAVDFNELNILIGLGPDIIPWFIDTDSYATPSFKATAIMDSIRDRKATVYDAKGTMHYKPTVLSDWYSWAIISFWVYTNVHPYRGNHPNYKPKDKHKQMDDGFSVFAPGVRVPPTVEDFAVIPKRHLDWYKLVFERGERSIPPQTDSTVPLLVPTQIITITGTDKLGVDQVASCGSPILWVQQILGVNYVVTKNSLYSGNNSVRLHNGTNKVVFCPAAGGSVVTATKAGGLVEFSELYTDVQIESLRSPDVFERNGAIYTVTNGALIESSFVPVGTKLVHRSKSVENISNLSAKMYEGCVVQDLLGKKYLTVPYALGRAFSKYLPGLDHVRIIDAKSDKNVTVLIGEEKGKYNRYVVVFDKRYQNFEIRVDADVPYDPINFAVLDNGLCLLLSAPDQIQLFSTANQFETLDNPPFDASMKLFATPKGFFFINGNTIHQIKRK